MTIYKYLYNVIWKIFMNNKKFHKNKCIDDLTLVELVLIVRSRGRVKKNKVNRAYEEIIKRIKSKIMYIVSQFNIPGHTKDDIYQEALYALRYKAIPDFKKNRCDYTRRKGKKKPYPFDNFAVLCIRRHLSTLLKSSYQNKKKALNIGISINQDNNSNYDDNLYLANILSISSDSLLKDIEASEYYKKLFNRLFENLSDFEKQVFLLYARKYSYKEIKNIINEYYEDKNEKINKKSVDNALSRIKQKAQIVFKKYEN